MTDWTHAKARTRRCTMRRAASLDVMVRRLSDLDAVAEVIYTPSPDPLMYRTVSHMLAMMKGYR